MKRPIRPSLMIAAIVMFAVTATCAWSAGGGQAAPSEPVRGDASRVNESAVVPDEIFSLFSLNVHYLVPGEDRTDWENRKYALSAALNEQEPDIVLFQEMETFEGGHVPSRNLQLEWVLETVPGYAAGAVGDPDEYPITQPILYRPDRFELVEQGFFFFSPTPDVLYAEPWEGGWPAFVSWVRLRMGRPEAAGREFFVYNVHVDAFSRENRISGVRLITERVLARSPPDLPVVVAGDFNGLKSAGFLRPLNDAGLTRAPANGATFHFGSGVSLYGAIDHVFHDRALTPLKAEVLNRKWKGMWPSDHHPILVVLGFREGKTVD